MVNTMYAFIFSGAICSLFDKIFWNGSLDYILVNGFFTFDLKDVYINVFSGLIILLLLFKNKFLNQIDDNIVKDFTKYILRKL
ncbi:signal peptidase II [Clostridium sp.]|uniref:signal peptidase II n=1 Tax=Clostridium sp. TaxID=1506 RepID=UPI003D6D9AB1